MKMNRSKAEIIRTQLATIVKKRKREGVSSLSHTAHTLLQTKLRTNGKLDIHGDMWYRWLMISGFHHAR